MKSHKGKSIAIFYCIVLFLFIGCCIAGRGLDGFLGEGVVWFSLELVIYYFFVDAIRAFIYKKTIFIGTLQLVHSDSTQDKKSYYERLCIFLLFSGLTIVLLYMMFENNRPWIN